MPIIINSVLSEFSLSVLDFIHSEMSVRQSLRLDIDLCVSDCDSSMYTCVSSACIIMGNGQIRRHFGVVRETML